MHGILFYGRDYFISPLLHLMDTVLSLPIVGDREEGWRHGAVEHLTKPVDRRRLLDAVRRHGGSANAAKLVLIEGELGRPQLYEDRLCATQHRIWPVVFVEW